MKQLYFIAIDKLLKAGFHERYADEESESKLWIDAVREWLEQKHQELSELENDGVITASEKKIIDGWMTQELLGELTVVPDDTERRNCGQSSETRQRMSDLECVNSKTATAPNPDVSVQRE